MATHFTGMGSRPANLKTEQFDMDSFFDFNQGTTQTSPATTSASRLDALSPFEKQQEERQRFNGPSHDYHQYKQQVGLPVGSMANLPPMSQAPDMFAGYGSGIGDMGFDGGFGGWSSGIDIDTDMNMDFNNPQTAMPAMFFPPPSKDNASDNFVNPTTIAGQEEPSSNVGRLWPGMHSQQAQQAAMQKAAHSQQVQSRQMKMQSQQAQYRQSASGSHSQASSQSNATGKRASHVTEPHVEESISRLLNQMRNNSHGSVDEDGSSSGLLPHIARMKKDEEEMDEDERLLASDEGKKLSSKERRQLRNKVSARAFRSRRKGMYSKCLLYEYIGQLEGEVAMKAQEGSDLRQENQALMQENERYRGLIETLLRHPAFTPFIDDISKNPSVLGMPSQQPQQSQQQARSQPQPTPSQQPVQPQQLSSQERDLKPDFMNFDASQLQLPGQQQQDSQQVGLAMIPEENFSKLNLNGFQQAMNFNDYHSVNAYAVTNVPRCDPVKLLIDSPARLPSIHAASLTSAASVTDYSAYNSDMTVLLAKLDCAAGKLGTV